MDDDRRSRLRQMLDDIRFWKSVGRREYDKGVDVTDSWFSEKLKRARSYWRVIDARERWNA